MKVSIVLELPSLSEARLTYVLKRLPQFHLNRPGRIPSSYSLKLCSNLVCCDGRRVGGLIVFDPWSTFRASSASGDHFLKKENQVMICFPKWSKWGCSVSVLCIGIHKVNCFVFLCWTVHKLIKASQWWVQCDMIEVAWDRNEGIRVLSLKPHDSRVGGMECENSLGM